MSFSLVGVCKQPQMIFVPLRCRYTKSLIRKKHPHLKAPIQEYVYILECINGGLFYSTPKLANNSLSSLSYCSFLAESSFSALIERNFFDRLL